MTHDELKSVVLNHVPPAYQRALLAVVDECMRLRALAPAPVVPLTPDQIDAELPGYLAKESRK